MMKELKKQIYLRWDEIALLFGLQAIFFLMGEVLVAITIQIFHDDEIVEVGTMMALAVPLFMSVFIGISSLGTCFNMGLSMCDTRKRLVPMFFIISYLECMATVGVAYILRWLEKWIFQIFYPELKNAEELGFLFQWKYVLVACLAIVAVQALFGVAFLKYGKVAFWIVWAIWMFIFLGGPRITKMITQHPQSLAAQTAEKILNYFISTEGMMLGGLTGLSMILIMVSYLVLRKQQVNL